MKIKKRLTMVALVGVMVLGLGGVAYGATLLTGTQKGISEKVVLTYNKVEDAVVSNYKAIEDSAVSTLQNAGVKIEQTKTEDNAVREDNARREYNAER